MTNLTMISTVDLPTTISSEELEKFISGLGGTVVTPESPDYDSARTIWNAMVDKHPSMIVRCTSTADVIHSVKFAREHNLLVAVKGAGHNIAGNAICNGGLVIDLSQMKSIRVDTATQRAYAEPGLT